MKAKRTLSSFLIPTFATQQENKTMPVTKDAMARYRVIDKMLADPNRTYTTAEILDRVIHQCNLRDDFSLRMIQKDLLALQGPPFNKKLVRNEGRRGTVRYADQSDPLFFQELTSDEEEVLREALHSLGQFEGLDNFTWLELLKKKLDFKERKGEQPYISFSHNEVLQIPKGLLGRLFSAISQKKVITITYTAFGRDPEKHTVYPYQLKQYNDRWWLICTPLGNQKHPYNREFIATFPLDRIDGQFEYHDDEPYIPTPVDLKERFDQIVGVTLYENEELQDIYFAVSKKSLPYIQTKYLHCTQIELDEESQEIYRKRYPALKDWTFFSIECRPNPELYMKLLSYGENIILVEPKELKDKMLAMLSSAHGKYQGI